MPKVSLRFCPSLAIVFALVSGSAILSANPWGQNSRPLRVRVSAESMAENL
jgi:hypothetical protein